MITPKRHLENVSFPAKPNPFRVLGGRSRGGFSVFLNETEVTFYFIFMAEGVNQVTLEMSLHLHRIVAAQEAHAALLRLQEH